jgi:hypothetical protein
MSPYNAKKSAPASAEAQGVTALRNNQPNQHLYLEAEIQSAVNA